MSASQGVTWKEVEHLRKRAQDEKLTSAERAELNSSANALANILRAQEREHPPTVTELFESYQAGVSVADWRAA